MKALLPSSILAKCPAQSQSSRLTPNHPDYIRWTVQTMKFLIVKPSPLPINLTDSLFIYLFQKQEKKEKTLTKKKEEISRWKTHIIIWKLTRYVSTITDVFLNEKRVNVQLQWTFTFLIWEWNGPEQLVSEFNAANSVFLKRIQFLIIVQIKWNHSPSNCSCKFYNLSMDMLY